MKIFIAIFFSIFSLTSIAQNTSGIKVSSQVINESQLPAAANAYLKQMHKLHTRKITRSETSDKQVYYTVEMTSKDSKEFYILKFSANGSLIKDSVNK